MIRCFAFVRLSAAASPATFASFDPFELAALDAETEAEEAAEEILERTEEADFEATDDAEEALFGAALVADAADLLTDEAPRPI
jgi:hypothetical protein